MNFCLSDLVPPLRWSDAATIPLLRDQPELPDAWWRNLPMARVLAVLGPERLAEILAGIALRHWPSASVGDILPALYVLDPDEADEPCTAIALDRTGSWPGLLSLTGHDLRDQPFIQPLPLLNALFTAAFSRLTAPASGAAPRSSATPAVASGAGTEVPESEGVLFGARAADNPATPETPPQAPQVAAVEDRETAPAPESTVSKVTSDSVSDLEAVQTPESGVGIGVGPDDAPEPEVSPAAADPEPEALRQVENLHALVDGVFASLEDKRWAVAQNRLFSDAPAAVEALAKLFAVRPEVIQDLEADLRQQLMEWLASDEAAPYRDHLEEVKKVLGKAAPRERLITAAGWHTHELHSLDVPAWQFVLATLPGYHLVDEWLVEGDIAELRHRTRDMISGAKPPLTINKALDMVSSLGIHPEVSKEWLENVPQLRILGAGQRAAAQRSNGSAASTMAAEKPVAAGRLANGDAGQPVGTETRDAEQPAGTEPEREPAKAPFRPLKDVSLTRRCFRQPDGRWWLRIDVTSEHIQGAECPLPSGFAAYLGMSPGSGRTVNSAVGELTLNWQDRPVLESLEKLLEDVGAKEGSHLFLTLSDEGVLRARHLPAAGKDVEPTAQALRLVGYTAAGGTHEQVGRVIATRVGMMGHIGLPDLLVRLRERGDRDLLSLLA